jgi:hypothetical protein
MIESRVQAAQRGGTLHRLNICAFLADLNVLATVNHESTFAFAPLRRGGRIDTNPVYIRVHLRPLMLEISYQDSLSRD